MLIRFVQYYNGQNVVLLAQLFQKNSEKQAVILSFKGLYVAKNYRIKIQAIQAILLQMRIFVGNHIIDSNHDCDLTDNLMQDAIRNNVIFIIRITMVISVVLDD